MVFIFISGGLYVLIDNIVRGNIVETNDVTNKTSVLTDIQTRLNSNYNATRDTYDTLTRSKPDELDFWGSLLNGAYTALTTVANTFDIINVVVTNILDTLHIPVFFLSAIFISVLAAVTFSIIYMIFRFQPR